MGVFDLIRHDNELIIGLCVDADQSGSCRHHFLRFDHDAVVDAERSDWSEQFLGTVMPSNSHFGEVTNEFSGTAFNPESIRLIHVNSELWRIERHRTEASTGNGDASLESWAAGPSDQEPAMLPPGLQPRLLAYDGSVIAGVQRIDEALSEGMGIDAAFDWWAYERSTARWQPLGHDPLISLDSLDPLSGRAHSALANEATPQG